MGFTEFCCRAGGSNLNPGTRQGTSVEPGPSADHSYSGAWDGDSVFTVSSGNPLTDGVTTNDFMAVSASGATTWGVMGCISDVTATTVTMGGNNTAVFAGNISPGAGTLRIGGAMAGPSGASGFPLNFLMDSATNAAGDPVRINLKNDKTYSLTAQLTISDNNPAQIFGYGSAYGDGGKTTISGPTTGASFRLLNSTTSAQSLWLDSIIFKNNGATGTVAGVFPGNSLITRCVFRDMCGSGVNAGTNICYLDECEVFNCNTKQPTGAALNLAGPNVQVSNSIIHNNLGLGLTALNGIVTIVNTIFDSNASHGMNFGGTSPMLILNCDCYHNQGSGILLPSGSAEFVIRNSNFVRNGAWGIGGSVVGSLIMNCGFGSGTMANVSGDIQSTHFVESGHITYPSGITPWSSPDTGDFRISSYLAQNTGIYIYSRLTSAYSGTIAYCDIGAGQHAGTVTPYNAY